MAHADDDPVIFHYTASCNISSFHSKGDSGYTWGDWREMNDEERAEAYNMFIFDTLGVEVWEDEDK